MSKHLFVYGSLQVPEVVDGLLGRVPEGEPARLAGYRQRRVRGAIYPGIAPDAWESTEGRLYHNIAPSEWTALDDFEGEEYRRETVEVTTASGPVTAWAYILDDPTALDGEVWSLETFVERESWRLWFGERKK